MRTASSSFRVLAAAAILAVSGCSMMQPQREDDHLAAFSTRMTGMNEVPAVATTATGTVDAVLDKQTNLLRWKMSFNNLSGPATMAHFHGPAAIGANAGVVLPFKAPVASPYEGRATLTAQQAADLLAGKWYVNVHTAKNPAGEIRGQMIERK
ncbi:CHRD domain-containing protein [Variovorax terrae]|uniref:CHRD domain-containing protein n=1 Tax=Variovorax terrae TaxID=2923278 RepID=A0A9X1VX15_9BURK|nr:CHRD domain-containing protein [Variovorax terrae]MCJ0763487.1 CHRD domain-containing protein [Variovorax terrae]